jgi:Uri superfamily endonuclease
MQPPQSVPGIYTLVLHLIDELEISVGSLGKISFAAGYYSYTGSGRGPGGLKRVQRHLQVLAGIKTTKRWHIDYLLPYTSIQEVFITPTKVDLECQIASSIGKQLASIKGFGCSDCRCQSHLHYAKDSERMLQAVRQAHSRGFILI